MISDYRIGELDRVVNGNAMKGETQRMDGKI
jgi:hypothetical protein